MYLAGMIYQGGQSKQENKEEELAKESSRSFRQSLKLIPSEGILPKLYFEFCFQLESA